jgi:hypothetical protein
MVRGGGGRVVAQQPVLHDHVADVDPKPRDAAVEPESEDAVELVADRVGPPVEVSLLDEEVAQVGLTGAVVGFPRRTEEGTHPVVRG